MAYGLWLYKEIVNDTGKKTRLEIEKRDYVGQSCEIAALSGDIVLSIDGGSATDPIVKSNLSFSIIDTAQVTYSDFFTPDATLYRVKVYDVNGQTQTVRWTGFVTPDSFGEPLTYRGQINLTARDNLGYLNDLEFDYNNATAESYASIKNIINAAITKIGGMPLVWNVAKKASTAADGTFDNIEDAIVSTYTMLGDTWGNVVSELLKGIGCQLRYIDNNTFAVYDIEVLSDSVTFTAQQIRFLEQSGYREIQPAWKKGVFNQDYGFVSEFSLPLPNGYSGSLVYTQNNTHRWSYGNYIYLHTSMLGWGISRGDVLNPQTWGICDPYDPQETDYSHDRDAIYLPFSDINNDTTREKMYIQKTTTISKITASIDVEMLIGWGMYFSPYRDPDNPYRTYIQGLTYGSSSSGTYYEYDAKDFLYNIILDGEDGNRYYLREEWTLEENLSDKWLIVRIPPKLDTDYMTIRNVIHTTPCGGTLILRIYAPSGEFCYSRDYTGARYESFHLETSLKIKSVTISNDVDVSGGRSRQGDINQAHNVVNDEEYLYGQIPSASYGIEFIKGGIYKNNAAYTPYSHFKRNSSATATDNLLDLIGRETIQYHKKSWDILSGTVQVTDRTSVMRFGTLTYGGKRYLPISAALNLLANQMSVTSMLEIENYTEEASIVFSDYAGKSSYSGRSGGGSSSGGSGTSISAHNQLAGRGEDDAHPLSAITGLSDFKDLFDSMFVKKPKTGGGYYIEAQLDFVSILGVTAYGNGSGGGGGSGSAVWGGIVGTLSNQTDLMVALAEKSNVGHTHAYDTISGRPSLALVATSGSYNDLTDRPTIPSLAGYATQSWVQSQNYLTSITKAMVEGVLTGNISSHTHSYLPLSGGTMSGAIQMAGNRIKCNTYTIHNELLDDTSHGLTTFSISTPSESAVSYLGILSVNDIYKFQIGSSGGGGNVLKYRGYNGNAATWDDWVSIYHSGNCNKNTVPWACSQLTIGSIVLDVVDGNLRINGNVFATGGVSAYGQNSGGGGEGNYTYWMQDPTDGRTHATLRAVLTGGTATKDGDVSLNGHTHAYSDITGRPNLSAVATSGNYNDLSNKPQSIKNPYSLTFGSKTYDGSSAKTITASDLGALTAHQTVTLASGTNNGTVKLTVGGTTTDNIAVKGLAAMAYKASLSASDIPSLDASKITSGTFADARIASSAAWNAKYDKPSGGIPKSDLASSVQASLGKADTALQSHQTIYTLTIQKNGATVDSFKANTANKTINISDVASAATLSALLTKFNNMFDLEGDGTSASPYMVKALHDFYSVGGVSAYGEGQGGGGGLTFTAIAYANLSALTTEEMSKIPTAYAAKMLMNRISALEGGSATSISVTGSGNAVTSVSKSGTTITFTKGSTFSLTGHTHSISDVTGLQTVLDGKQATISDLATIRSNAANGNTAYGWGNHASQGYLTAITKTMVENVLTGNIASHTHSQYLASALAATTYHPKGGSTALPFSASSLNLSGAITGATNINSVLYFDTLKSDFQCTTSSIPSQGSLASVPHVSIGIKGLYGMYFYTTGNGAGHIQQGRADGTATHYNLCLQELGGNVGIGTTSPSYKLDVNGTLNATTIYQGGTALANTYHPKFGSTALPFDAKSLSLAGEISGATDITASGTGTMKEIVLSNNGHSVKIELDANGNLKINGNVFATGGVTAYQTA